MTDQPGDSATTMPNRNAAELVARWREMRGEGQRAVSGVGTAHGTPSGGGVARLNLEATGHGVAPPAVPPEVAVGFALLDMGPKVDEGRLILAVRPAWRNVIASLEKDPNALSRLTPRQFEELLAGGYREDGWEVVLTPASGDRGVDIIATRSDFGSIRVLDQAKLYKPGHLVPAHDVRAMVHVIDRNRKASKGLITTTSDFAPGVRNEFRDYIPTRLELRSGADLRAWLQKLFTN